MQFCLPRALLAASISLLLCTVLVAACSRASGARPDNNKAWALKIQPEVASSAQTSSPKQISSAATSDSGEISSTEHTSSSQIPDAAPTQKATRDEFSFAVVSDLNGRYGSTEYGEDVHEGVRWLTELEPDLVLSTGDMVAGQRRGLDYPGMWASFHTAVTTPLARAGIPFAVTPGNHDASAGAAYLEERITFIEQWRRHRPDLDFVDDRFYPLHYAFKMKGVLFISLDATMVGPLDAAQMRWLREVLRANPDARARVVYGHIPLYPVTQGREREILNDPALEALLNEFDVDLMLTGHHHGYFPGRRGNLRLVTMACLGSGQRKLVGTDTVSPKSLLLVHVDTDGEFSIDAFDPRTRERVDPETLPEFLNDEPQRIWRDDVSEENRHEDTI